MRIVALLDSRPLAPLAALTLALTLTLSGGLGCSRNAPSVAGASTGEPSTSVHAEGFGDAATALPAVNANANANDTSTVVRTPPPPPKDGVYLGRRLATPMSHLGAAWLDRATRDAEQRPEHVLDVLGVRGGQRVCDFGAGSGYFTLHLAKRVGLEGKVFAVDVQPEMLTLLRTKLTKENVTNVIPVLAKPSVASLSRASVDLVLMVDVYHELERPDLTLAQLREALAPGGRIALVEYRAEDPKVAIKPEHKMTLVQLRKEAEASGYAVERVDESLPQQRIVSLAP